jgi:glycosyltransferase involved in cell wall biosynthesis
MKISVIIPVFNEEKDIAECLESLKQQKFDGFEIIVVDDGSTDRTSEVLSKYQKSNSKIQILEQNHKGPAASRNFGAKHAKGEVLVFLDADMTFDKNFLRMLTKPVFTGKSRGTWSRDEYVSNWDNAWARCWNINQNWMRKRRHPKKYSKTQKVFRSILKKEFDRVGGFDMEGYTDDYTLSKKLGYEATLAEKAFFYHKNPDSLGEVFVQAKWGAKRSYKLGFLGVAIALVRSSFPFSLIVGVLKAIINKTPRFLLFKIVYDAGAFLGILGYNLSKKGYK